MKTRNTLTRIEVEELLELTRLKTQTELASRIGITFHHLSFMMNQDEISKKTSKEIIRQWPAKMSKILPLEVFRTMSGHGPTESVQRQRQYLSSGTIKQRLKDEHGIALSPRQLKIILMEARKKV